MDVVLKFSLFCLVLFFMMMGAYKLYNGLNEKINGSRTGIELIGFALLLMVSNVILFFGGLFIFLKVYEYLFQPV